LFSSHCLSPPVENICFYYRYFGRISLLGIRVNYSGNAANEHWVGVTGTYSESGTDYFVISGTSANDSVMGNNPGGNNRGGMGWRNVEGVGTVVPVNAVTAYRIFTVNPPK
jgi:hypothetical protein